MLIDELLGLPVNGIDKIVGLAKLIGEVQMKKKDLVEEKSL